MSAPRTYLLPLLLGLAAVSAPVIARAQTESSSDVETARAAFQQGLELRDQRHDVRGAIEKLKAAYALVQTPRIAFELGKTQRMANDYVGARQTFLEVDRLPVRVNESPEAKKARSDAKAQAAELEGLIPTLAIKLVGEGEAVVTIDDQPVARDALAVVHKLNPGTHTVALQIEGRAPIKRTVQLKEGDQKEIEIKLPARGQPAPADPTDDGLKATSYQTGSTRNDPAHVWLGIGFFAGLTVGSITGAYAIVAAADGAKSSACATGKCDARDKATALAWVANVSFGVGLLSGALWLIIPPVERRYGTTLGVVDVPGGAMLSARGTF